MHTSESTNRASIFHENLVCLLNPETYFSKYIVLLLRSVLFVIKIMAFCIEHIISPQRILTKKADDGRVLEPFEEVTVDVDS